MIWEYAVSDLKAKLPQELEMALTLFGLSGWELVSVVDGDRFIFKRAKT